MGIRKVLASQGVKPRGLFGWIIVRFFEAPLRLFAEKLYRKIADLLDLRPEDDLLDVACGSGMFLQKHASHVHRIAGMDHSEIQISMARRRSSERIAAGMAEMVVGDSAALPWEDNGFTAVTCNCIGCFADLQIRSMAA